MWFVFALSWAEFVQSLTSPWEIIKQGLVMLGAALLGGVLFGFVVRRILLLLWKDPSRAALLRLRLLGGIGSAALAYLLLNEGGLGPGFGTGSGGAPRANVGEPKVEESSPLSPHSPAISPQKLVPSPIEEATVLRIKLLGTQTDPAYAPPDGFFTLADDPSSKPMDVGTTMRRIMDFKRRGKLKEVELAITRQSTLLENPVVDQLRESVLREARVPFVQPNPERPFSGQKIRYDQPGTP
jgi:hypothetical protein